MGFEAKHLRREQEELVTVLQGCVFGKELRIGAEGIQEAHYIDPLLSFRQLPIILQKQQENVHESPLELYRQALELKLSLGLLFKRRHRHSSFWVV